MKLSRSVSLLLLVPLLLLGLVVSRAPAADAESDWKQINDMNRPLSPPEEWETKPPSESEKRKFLARNADRAFQLAEKVRNFYTHYPDHKKSEQARMMELSLLQIAVRWGRTDLVKTRDQVEEKWLKDPKTPPELRFEIRLEQVERTAQEEAKTNYTAWFEARDRGVRKLKEEFPNQPELYPLMLKIARSLEGEKGASLARLAMEGNKSPELQEMAATIIFHASLLGKPLELKFESLEGKPVDMSTMRGKVVLVDFWATWCPPCMAELPELKELYSELQSKGFEIVGINLDEDKSELRKFLKKQKITWPQFFDGKGFETPIVQNLRVSSLPTAWLVDKKGKLRYLQGTFELKEKVQALLAEKG